jgi:hypothetical protein
MGLSLVPLAEGRIPEQKRRTRWRGTLATPDWALKTAVRGLQGANIQLTLFKHSAVYCGKTFGHFVFFS